VQCIALTGELHMRVTASVLRCNVTDMKYSDIEPSKSYCE